MNHAIGLCTLSSLLLTVLLTGCGQSSSIRVNERTEPNGTKICELDVQNGSLKEVCVALGTKLEKPIKLGPNVNPDRHIKDIHLETNDWLGILNGFAEGMGHLAVSVADDEITLNSE